MAAQVILASASSIRSQMLNNVGINHEIFPARIDEDAIKASLISELTEPRDMADILADLKAKKVSVQQPDAFVIGADQVLEFGNQIYSKPKTQDDLKGLLLKLNGHDHILYSAAVIYKETRPVWRHVGKVTLTMRDLSSAYIHDYVTKEWDNVRFCVGGYKIEEKGLRLFDKIDGDYFSILGLPLLDIVRFFDANGVLEN